MNNKSSRPDNQFELFTVYQTMIRQLETDPTLPMHGKETHELYPYSKHCRLLDTLRDALHDDKPIKVNAEMLDVCVRDYLVQRLRLVEAETLEYIQSQCGALRMPPVPLYDPAAAQQVTQHASHKLTQLLGELGI
jgi:hypothetical protein